MILIGAALLRFESLRQRGLIYWDEGKFALEGVRMLSVIHAFPHIHYGVLAGKAVGTAKPTHALLIALSFSLLGVHDYAPLFLNATMSVLQVGVVALVGRRFFGMPVALLAAGFLAVSGYDVIYARSALSESDANLLFSCGVLAWSLGWRKGVDGTWEPLAAHWRTRVPAGLLLGLGFTTNYRLAVYIVTMVAVDMLALFLKSGWKESLRAGGFWLLGLALFPVLWQMVGLLTAAGGVTLFRGEITYRPTTYLSEVLYQLHGGRQSVFRFNPLIYVQWFAVRQGWLMLLLVLVGLASGAVRRSFGWVVVSSLVVIPYCVYVFAPIIVPRNLDTALPFAALLAAAGLAALLERVAGMRVRRALLVASAVFLLVAGTDISWRLTGERSGFVEAATFLAHHGDAQGLVTNEIMVFYLRDRGLGCDAPRLPVSLVSLSAAHARGYKFAVVDDYQTDLERILLHYGRVIARYPAVDVPMLGENPIASENGAWPGTNLTQTIRIYAIDSVHLPRLVQRLKVACSLDRLA